MAGNINNKISERIGRKVLKFLPAIGMVLPLLSAAGCSDKDLAIKEGDGNKYGTETEITLTYPVLLDQIAGTRADESIDNYIDKEHLQVLFFDSDGKFMFTDTQARVADSPDKNGQYYVTTSLTNSLTDNSNNSILSLIRDKMESGNFKIAVLANWYADAAQPYSVKWGWSESVFNDPRKCKTINDLHHLEVDGKSKYGENFPSVAGPEGEMGMNSSWVTSRDVEKGKGYEFTDPKQDAWHLSAEELDNDPKISNDAYTWIRKNWNPVKDKATTGATEHGIYRHYENLWQLWLMGGGYDDNCYSYTDLKAEKFKDEWKARNWTNPQASDNAIGLETWVSSDGFVPGDGKNSMVDGLRVVSKSYTAGTNNVNDYVRSYKKTFSGKQYCGLILPAMNSHAYEGSDPDKETIKISSGYAYEYLNFSVPGTGTLRVLFSSLDGKEATLVVQRGTTFEAKFTAPGNSGGNSAPTIMEISKKSGTVEVDNKEAGYLVDITEDAEDINLFCLSGNVVIYAIEYNCGDYLKTTDREGVIPSQRFPIPMYGVEEFPRITGWGSTKTMSLSKTIYLIRALAKVEVYFPAGENTLTHIYLRSMNQRAWNEPMDVETSTYSLWKMHEENAEQNCEWYRIQKHGSGYKYSGGFNDWFHWFYGSWNNWGWPDLQFSDTQNPPQLFNPEIQRADFCHFIRDWDYADENMHRYYLYVPDKNISDPGSNGSVNSTPKVPHIEYRYANNSNYLDDNDCYRVYFTDYSSNDEIKRVKRNQFNEYETGNGSDGKSNLDKHWPIMRNHIYRFYIGTSNTPQEVRVQVLPWGDAAVKKVEW